MLFVDSFTSQYKEARAEEEGEDLTLVPDSFACPIDSWLDALPRQKDDYDFSDFNTSWKSSNSKMKIKFKLSQPTRLTLKLRTKPNSR